MWIFAGSIPSHRGTASNFGASVALGVVGSIAKFRTGFAGVEVSVVRPAAWRSALPAVWTDGQTCMAAESMRWLVHQVFERLKCPIFGVPQCFRVRECQECLVDPGTAGASCGVWIGSGAKGVGPRVAVLSLPKIKKSG